MIQYPYSLLCCLLLLSSVSLIAQEVLPYMGGKAELREAPNGAIANKRLLDGIDKVAWIEAARVLGLFDRYDPERAVVIPSTLVQDHR